jgi:hypothetical protein
MDNFTDIDDGLYVEDEELLSIVFNIISKDVVLRSILNMVDDRLGKKAKVNPVAGQLDNANSEQEMLVIIIVQSVNIVFGQS